MLPRIDSNPDADGVDLVHGLSGIASPRGVKLQISSGSQSLSIAADIGLAAWDLVNIDRYRAIWLKAHD